MQTDPRSLLRTLFDAAIAAAQPDKTLPAYLPGRPKGRTLVVGCGKAAGSMAKAVEDNWPGELSGMVVTRYGYGVPTAVVPYTNKVMALHPALHDSLGKLRDWGVHVLYGEDVCRLGAPGQTDRFRHQFPWRRALQAVSNPVTMSSRVEPGTVA